MNREIKFRAWDLDKKEMVGVRSIHFDTEYNIIACYCKMDQRGDAPIKNFVLMAYTGLKDSKGVKIYEGDILKSNSIIGEVYFDKESASFRFYNNYHLRKIDLAYEVIGNIYDNPDLLKDQKEKK